MRTVMTFLVVGLAIGSAACKKKEQPAAGSAAGSGSGSQMMGSDTGSGGSGSAAMAGSGSGSQMMGSDMGSAGSGSGSGSAAAAADGEMQKKAGNCPSMVFGAITKAEVKGKDVLLTITSEDKDAVLAIQKRTETLLKEKQDAPTGGAHDQKGTHGGGSGMCPVYAGEGGTAKAKNDAKGVTVTLTPKEKPEDLKAKIDDRITKAADWVTKNIKPGDAANTGGVGGGKGGHGSHHEGSGDGKGKDRAGGTGGGAGTGGGGGKGTGGGAGAGAKK